MNDTTDYVKNREVKLSILKSVSQMSLNGLELPSNYMPFVVLAGGAFVSWYHNQKAKDIDIFILDSGNEQTNEAIEMILMANFSFLRKKSPEYKGYTLNPNVIKVWDVQTKIKGSLPYKYQIIFTKYRTREDLIAHFDFVHCTMNYYNGKLYFTKNTYDCIDTKRLAVNNILNASIARYRYNKFINRGFVDNNNEIQKRLFGSYKLNQNTNTYRPSIMYNMDMI